MSLKSHVTAFSPSQSPGVLDEPVVISVSSKNNTVVEASVSWAFSSADNSTLVDLPSLVGIDGNSNRSLVGEVVEGLNSGTLFKSDNRFEVLDILFLKSAALERNAAVRIVLSMSLSVVLDVPVESLFHKTSEASKTSTLSDVTAVNEFLLRHVSHLTSLESPVALESTSG